MNRKKLGVITELLEYDVKSCFYMFQRLSLDYSPYTEIMFDWIKSDLTNPKTNKKIINLLQEEYLYLVIQPNPTRHLLTLPTRSNRTTNNSPKSSPK